jgi:hypothetical protein
VNSLILLNAEHTQVFTEQVNDHIEKLNVLMGLAAGAEITENGMMKAALATKLLEGSTGMLGIGEWSAALGRLRDLIETAARSGAHWDEQLSQLVSEFLEAEELAVSELLTGNADIDWSAAFGGLTREMEFLLEQLSERGASSEPRVAESDTVTLDVPEGSGSGGSDGFTTLDKLMGTLYRVKDQFREYLEGQSPKESVIADLELSFGESEFYINLIGNILNRLGDSRKPFTAKVSSDTALEGVDDFFSLHGGIRNWNAKLRTRSDEFSLERGAATALAVILESCLFDTCRMYEEQKSLALDVEVSVKDEGTYLTAEITDNGPNFLCDSEIDCDDTVAFYPGLLRVRSLLERCGGILWVEPDSARGARFRFTLPHSSIETDYHIFDFSGLECAVPRHSVVDIVERGARSIREENGERYDVSGSARVPVYSMEELTMEGASHERSGDRIVVLGYAEKRVELVANGPGRRVRGVLDQCTDGNWKALSRRLLHLGEREYPVLDVGCVLQEVDKLKGLEGVHDEPGSIAAGEEVGFAFEEIPVPRV